MSKKCFFVTPIGAEGSEDRKRADDALEFFLTPVCKELGFEVIRVDKLNTVDKISESVLEFIRTSELVIVDMTSHNPNVFYEFGFRHALGKPLIPIIIKDSDPIPFDVYDLRTIFYSMEARSLKDASDTLKETIQGINFDDIDYEKTQQTVDSNIPLLKINDKLDLILTAIEERNTSDIDLVSEQVAKYASPQQSLESTMTQALMPMLVNDPEAFMKLANQFSDLK